MICEEDRSLDAGLGCAVPSVVAEANKLHIRYRTLYMLAAERGRYPTNIFALVKNQVWKRETGELNQEFNREELSRQAVVFGYCIAHHISKLIKAHVEKEGTEEHLSNPYAFKVSQEEKFELLMEDLSSIRQTVLTSCSTHFLYNKVLRDKLGSHYVLMALQTKDQPMTSNVIFPDILNDGQPLMFRGNHLPIIPGKEENDVPSLVQVYQDDARLAFFTGLVHWAANHTSLNVDSCVTAAMFYHVHHQHLTASELISGGARSGVFPRTGSVGKSQNAGWLVLMVVGFAMEFLDSHYIENKIDNVSAVKLTFTGGKSITTGIAEQVLQYLTPVFADNMSAGEGPGQGLTFFPADNQLGQILSLGPVISQSDPEGCVKIRSVPYGVNSSNYGQSSSTKLNRDGIIILDKTRLSPAWAYDVVLCDPKTVQTVRHKAIGSGVVTRKTAFMDDLDPKNCHALDLFWGMCLGHPWEANPRWVLHVRTAAPCRLQLPVEIDFVTGPSFGTTHSSPTPRRRSKRRKPKSD
jgi:hypothetical protein